VILRVLTRLLLVLVVLAGALAAVLKLRYGGGDDFPDRHTGAPRLPASALEVVANLPTPPGNIAVSASGRVFITLHPEAHPATKVVELKDGVPMPFPNAAWQDPETDPRHFRDVLPVRIDRADRLWTLDNGAHGTHPARLMAFNIDTGEVAHEYEFPREIAGLGSHFNDFQVAPDGRFVYIADASFFAKTPAIVVYDVAAHSARRLLEGHPAVTADYFTPVVQGRRMVAFGLVSIRPGVDSIGLDAAGEWLYFAPVTSLQLYRARTADLVDAQLSAAELAGRVEVYAPKTMSDGIALDAAGNVYLTDLEHSAITVLRTDRTLETLVQSPQLRWPDGLSFGPNGTLYLTCSSLHQVIGLPPASVGAHAPYQVLRLALGVEAVPGH
jgi:sugar lactone lactonase YvrE